MCFAGDYWPIPRARALLHLAPLAILLVAGCPRDPANNGDAATSKPPPPVRLMVVGDAELATAIQREWQASGRGDLEIKVASAADLKNIVRLPADVIIYPSGMVGELRQRGLIAPLPGWTAESDQLNRADIFPLVRNAETMWGHELLAVPLGSPQLVVLYRKDILEKLGRTPPTTWREFDELATLIARSNDIAELPGASDATWQPVAQPLAKGWAGQVLLARAAPYVRHPDHYSALFDYQTMQPLIDQRPFVRALEELVGAASPASLEDTPATIQQRLLGGRCALAITWPTPAVDWPEGEGAIEAPLGCFEMPGSKDVYNFEAARWETRDQPQFVPLLAVSGYLGSVSASARHTRSAADALVWLASGQTGQNIALASGHCSPCRTSQVGSASSWVSRDFGADVAGEYTDVLQAANSRPHWLFSPRIPGREEYVAALDNAVRTAVMGEKSPQLALADAADQWRQITDKYGVEQQRKAYMRSLGLQP